MKIYNCLIIIFFSFISFNRNKKETLSLNTFETSILEAIDYNSFRTRENTGCFAKDKNEYYFWGDKTNINDWEEDVESKKMIDELDRL